MQFDVQMLLQHINTVKRAPKRAYPHFDDFHSDVKNANFFCGRPSRPCLCSRLSLTARPTHFEANHFLGDPDFDVKNANFFVDVRQDLVYVASWSSRSVRPILKQTFLGDSNSDVKNTKFILDVRLYLGYAASWLSQPIQLIFKVKRAPKRAYPNFDDFYLGYAASWPSRPVRPILKVKRVSKHAYPHFDDFIPTSKLRNFFVDVRIDLVYVASWPSRPVRPIFIVKEASKRAYSPFRRFSCAIANHFLSYPNSDVRNAKSFFGRPSRPCLCIQFALTASPTHFEGQTSIEASIPLISTIFVCYSKPFFR
uniref:Uncharacterized protein n=1 Tax=Solanum lycopersicum TaxID=4081 RepID=A0A3Q7GXB0_SOLLC